MRSILKRVLVVTVTQRDQFIATICKLEELLLKEKSVNLIVIDSFSFPIKFFEAGNKGFLQRTRIVAQLMTLLQILAKEFNVAVIVTNEFTTAFSPSQNGFYAPSLGATFYHKIGQRLVLGRKPMSNIFYATLDKSIYCKSKTIELRVSEAQLFSLLKLKQFNSVSDF